MRGGPAEEPLPERKFGQGFRALVVDDDAEVRDILSELLEAAAFVVDAAADLREARELADARVPDLVVTDKNLPDGSGLELARYLTNRQADCEIVLVTAHGSTESAFEAFELGLADLLAKPFRDLAHVRRAFRKALERLLSARRAADSRQTPPGPPVPSSESQRRLRFFVELRARFILVDGSLTGPAFVSQLSTTDLFVETDRPLPIGTRVRLRLYIPGQPASDLSAVVRRHGESANMRGMRLALTDPSEEALARISAHLEPSRRRFAQSGVPVSSLLASTAGEESDARAGGTAESGSAAAIGGDLGSRFTPDALRMFLEMHGPRVLDFLDTLDTETVQALLDLDGRAADTLLEPPPARAPAPFEKLQPALFDPENADPEELPIVVGVEPGEPSEPADEEERLRRRYGLSEEILEGEEIRKKYGIDESIFLDDEEASPGEADGGATSPRRRTSVGMLEGLGKSPEQRAAFAKELRRRGEAAMQRGLVLRAAADLGLALAFAPDDLDLRAVAERVRAQANATRADDLYRQGLQQNALGDGDAAIKLLVGALELAPETKYAIAAARVLLQAGDVDSVRRSRSVLREAIKRDPDNADLHVLYGRTAEIEGYPKAALRSYRKALDLAPAHAAAAERLAQLEEA